VNTPGVARLHSFRAGRGTRRRLAWTQLRDFLRVRTVVVLVAILVGTGIVTAGVLWLAGAHGAWFGFVLGAQVAALGCGFAWLVVEQSGARAPLIGAVGEDWSADVLARLGSRWTRIDSIPFGSTLDIDHVLLSTAGVFAVETKFTASGWTESSPAFLGAVGDARWCARKIGFLLARTGKPRVTPMLIIWGPGAPSIPGGYELVDGVLVCRGADAERWRAHLEGLPPTTEPAQITEMIDIIVDHTQRTETANRS
jgi:hypothetical protein